MLPNFLIIGAMKAGTTSLYEYLRRHPDIFMPATKELNFFVAERNWSRGLSWYEKQFEGAGSAIAIGEATTHYTRHPYFTDVPERIAATLPKVRFIYLVRQPIERMRSEYIYRRLGGWEKRPLEEAWREDPTYVDGSRYASQIEQYLRFFTSSQLLILKSEDLQVERLPTVHKTLSFLGVREGWTDPALHRDFHRTAEQRMPSAVGLLVRRLPLYQNLAGAAPGSLKRAYKRLATRKIEPDEAAVTDSLARWAREQLQEEVKRLERYMEEDLDHWGLY